MATGEITVQYDERQRPPEAGVEIPIDRVNPETLRHLIEEFVTREWEELGDARFTLEEKIEQVERQLKDKKAAVVFDLSTETANFVVRG